MAFPILPFFFDDVPSNWVDCSLVWMVDICERDVIEDGWIIWSDGMIGLFSLCSTLDGVLRAHRITLHQVHIVSSLSSSLHSIVVVLQCTVQCPDLDGVLVTRHPSRDLLKRGLLILKTLFSGRSGRSGPTDGYLSAYLMHQVMHGRPDGTPLMINLRCAAYHSRQPDRLI